MKVEVNDYAKRRRSEYPPVEEQLDMLWHAMDDGRLPMVEEFYDRLGSVKKEHPHRPKLPPGQAKK